MKRSSPALLVAVLLLPLGTPACLSTFDAEGVELASGAAPEVNNNPVNNSPGNNAPNNNNSVNNSPGNNSPVNNNPGNNSAACTDRDGDGAPSGASCAEGLRVDCDDADASRSPFEAELCNGLDEDCDEVADEGVSAPTCPLREGVCLGSRKPCLGEAGFGACGAAEYGDAWVEEEDNLCDGLDNDCDGQTDEGCACEDGDTQPCGSDEGACEAGTQTCEGGAWGACLGGTGPGDEVCDGLDNDCDGAIDNDLEAPFCALQAGLCQGSRATCQGEAGWSACGATEYGDAWVQGEAGRCDGLDNDCDGTSDEGCACVDGESRACGTSVGACEEGSQACMGGAWGACEGAVGSMPEVCDGLDNDCDGVVDDVPQTTAGCTFLGGATATCMQGECIYACKSGYVDVNADLETLTSDGCECQIQAEVCDGADNSCDGLVDLDDPRVDRRTCLEQVLLPISPLGEPEVWPEPVLENQHVQRRFRLGRDACGLGTPVSAAVGTTAVCYVGADDAVWCAGTVGAFSSPGRFARVTALGEASGGPSRGRPMQVMISEGNLCAVYTSGEAWCMGDNASGEFGIGRTRGASSPVRWGRGELGGSVLSNIIYLVSNGGGEYCAMGATGSIACAGGVTGATARRGDELPAARFPGEAPPSRELRMILSGESVVIDSAEVLRVSGGSPGCFLSADGELLCGRDTWPPSAQAGSALLVDGAEPNGAEVEACWLNDIGEVWCVRNGTQLGLVRRAFEGSGPEPSKLGVALHLAAHNDEDAVCAVMDTGALWCLGDNPGGRLGRTQQRLAWPGQEVAPPGSVRTPDCR